MKKTDCKGVTNMEKLQKPKISLCMIVKDEEQFLPACLKSVQSVVDEIIIVDTGSKDKTIEIAKSFNAKIIQIPWEDDFAKARNVSLENATGEWVLHLDADEQIEEKDADLMFSLMEEYKTESEAFFLQVINCNYDMSGDQLSFPSVRLWKNHPNYRFKGALHEQIADSIVNSNPNKPIPLTPVQIYHYGYDKSVIKQKNKIERNLSIALKEVQKKPKFSFAHFNLAMEYGRQGELQKAVDEFRVALTLYKPHKDTEFWVSSLYKNYAATLIQLKKMREAIQILDQGLSKFPDYPDLMFDMALCHIELKEYPQAVGLLHQCILTTGNPKYPLQKGLSREKAYFLLGHCYMNLNQFDECIDSFIKAYKLNPQYKQPVRDLAKILNSL
jgi:glycosyltransferase involved in cell wall biosynthesis